MQKSNPLVRRSRRRSTSTRVLRFIAIALVIFAAVTVGVLQSGARSVAQNPTGTRTYQPTQIPITKFEPLNFAAAAAAEQLSAAIEGQEIEEADVPGEKPQFAGNVPINKAAIEAARSAQAPPSFGTGISPGPSKTFKAEFLSGTTIPPDTMGAVGTTHIVTVTNDRLRIQTRDGAEVSRMTVSSFWTGVTIKGAAVSAFDTKVFFDRFNNRFIIESSGNGVSVNSGALFAVSATADPTGTWYRWSVVADPASTSFPGGSGNWIDYPSVGFNENWIVVDENVFHYTCGATSCSNQSYWGQQVYVLDKQAAYSNTLGTINLFSDPFTNCVSPSEGILGCGFTMAPAVTEDNTTGTEYLVEDWDSTAAQLRLSKVTGTPSAPVLTVGTQFPQSANSWRFDAARIGTANNCGGTCSGGYAPQRQQSANLPSGSRIQTNDSRIQNSVLRNGKLWTTHHVMLSATAQPAGTQIGGTGNPIDNHSGIQWWQIDPTNETAASTPPLQRGRIEDPTANNCHNGTGGTTAVAPCNGTTAAQFGTFLAFPNISVNQNEDVLIGFTQMSPLIYPAGAYAMRKAADPPNTTRDVVVFRPGQSNYNIGAGSGTARQDRWGDYSAAQTDPLNDTDFWTVQEYAGTNRNDFLAPSYAGPWETWWAQVKPADAVPSNSGGLIISEFRLRGPQGVRDEFVELYNPALVPLIVQTTDNSDGWALVYSNNGTAITQVFAVIPNGTVIPPHGHFLIADNPDNTAGGTSALTYSLNAAACIQVRGADSDTGWSLDLGDNGGIALFNTATTANFSNSTRLDSAGFSSIAAGLFKEGNGIPAVTAATPTGQIAFYRDLSSGTPKDTGANENDFIFANTVVGETLGSNPRLGAAGPENLNSPISLSGAINLPAALVDTGVGLGSAPNYVRDNTVVTNGAFGTLTLRRSFTNNAGADLSRLRFRVVDITGNPPAGGAADLRVLSASATVVSLSGGGTANVAASTLETPPTQAAGGGLNGTLTIPSVTPTSPFTAGSTTNLQFTLGVQTTGTFNFCLVPESVFPSTVSGPLCFAGNTENTPPSITPATISRNGGDSSISTIATVNDSQDSAGSLTVTAISVPTGISVTGITNTSGTVTATVGADCSLATNAYNVTLQVMDSNGATANGTLVVNVTANAAPPTPTISADTNGTGTQDQACPEQPLTLHANGATGATSYQWYSNNNLINGATSSTYQATGAATYYVTATNACGTSSQSAGYVVQNPTPHSPFISFRGQASSVTTLAICQGSSQIIDSDSATGIQWYKDGVAIPGAMSQSYTATQAGVYTAQLNALGCHSQFGRNVTITVDAMPTTPTISGDTNGTGTQDQACPEEPLTLHAHSTGAVSYQWYSDNAPIGDGTATLVMTGVGNISVTATNGTCTTPRSATYVVQNPTPHSPFISFRNQSSSTTSLSICQGQSQIIDSDSATGIQWYKDGVAIPGAGNQSYTATQSGVYTAQLDALGCHSQFGRNVTLTVNPLPATPTINAGGPTTFCQGGSVTLTSSSASGNQWYLNNNPIGGATNNTYSATASGNYTVVATDGNGCPSAPSAATSVTVNPTPATPTINAGGPTTFCAGGSVTLTSSAATGNQWYLNGNAIGGATNKTYSATASGNYTVVATALSCPSAPSTATTVTVNLNPDATITTATQECAGSTGNSASVANAGGGATYNWSITNGTITGGTGTNSITYTAGAVGTLTLQVTVNTAASCSDTKSKNVTINAVPAKPTITPTGPTTFPSGGSVTLNSSSATGNQWYLNGNPIGGATNQSFVANAGGNYTVVVTTSSCSSPASDATTVTICPSSPVVTNANDSGAGSLRQAILDACDGATITFDMNQVVSPITLTTAELLVSKNLTIQGPGANVLTVMRSNAGGTPNFRIFNIAPAHTVTISGLTVSNGDVTAGTALGGGIYNNQSNLTLTDSVISGNHASSGGGIFNDKSFSAATLTVANSTISGNQSRNSGNLGGPGGGIGNTGVLTLTNSTVSGNQTANGIANGSGGDGGGVSNFGGTLTLTNTTVSGNVTGNGGSPGHGGYGGGISNSGTLTIVNSTISGNQTGGPNGVPGVGGGLYNGGTAYITNSTFTDNQTGASGNSGFIGYGNGGGILNQAANTINIKNIIVANNRIAASASGNDISGTFNSLDYNLIGDLASGGTLTGTTTHNLVNVNPLLGALANNGGPTQTHALLPGSPAIDAGDNCVTDVAHCSDPNIPQLTKDQRGFSRQAGTAVDIGAFESRGFSISTTNGTPQSVAINTSFAALVATVTSAFSEPVAGGIVTFTAPVSGASAKFAGNVTTLNATLNAGGQASATPTANSSAGGPYNVVASVAGSSTPANFALTNTKGNQTITFGPLASKNFGDPDFTVSASASSGLAVSFTASGNCTINTNTVHLTGAGSCTVTAKQAGDPNYNPAPDVPQSFTIGKAASATGLSSSLNPSTVGDNVTFTATVSAAAGLGTPTGTVAFKDGPAALTCSNAGGQTLNAGVATCQTATLTTGLHSISAVYSGDVNFSTSTGSVTQNVNPIQAPDIPLVTFSSPTYSVNESDGVVHLIVNRTGNMSAFNVDYATSDTGASTDCTKLNTGLASSRCDFNTALGTLKFAANQTQATIDVMINSDSFTEGAEIFIATLSNPTNGASVITPPIATITINDSAPPAGTTNAIDDTSAFVRQQYHDFLNREPDAAGLQFWKNNIDICNQPGGAVGFNSVAECIQVKRITTSAAFFLSIEFMQTGTFVRSFYVAALNRPNPPSATDPTADMPSFNEWLRDTQAVQRGVIVGQANWQTTLDANRLAFMQDFVMRAEFVGLYPTTDTPTQYINKLYSHALSRSPSSTELANALGVFGSAATANDATARGQALLQVTQASDFISRELPRTFVQMEYFGYLRRNPNDAPDNNFNGYNFWLNKLILFNSDFLKAEMVKAFLASSEYRQRFGN